MAKNNAFYACLLWLLISLCSNGQSALSGYTNTLRDRVIDSALSQVGVREATGHNDGKEVEKYLKTVGLGKGYAWCAAFITWDYKVNYVTDYKMAWASGWFPKSKILARSQIPEPGDLFGLKIDNRIGHVGMIYEWGEKVTKTIEGNTNSAGSREGDGVYVKRRLTRQIYVTSRWIKQ